MIVPAILASTPEEYQGRIEQIHDFAERVHIDVTDGEFATNSTVLEDQVWWPKEWKADIHMMVARPSEHLPMIIRLNPNMVIFHGEVSEDLVPIFEKLKNETMIKPGIALLRSTVPETVAPAIRAAEHVLVFSGNLGEYGGKAYMLQLEKIRLIKEINRNVEIGWDGGANIDNAFSLSQAGVDVINVGGAIANAADPSAVYRAMQQEVSRKGTI